MDMFLNEFCCGKTKVFSPFGLNVKAEWKEPINFTLLYLSPAACNPLYSYARSRFSITTPPDTAMFIPLSFANNG